ncbi:12386_t:CDS:2 [Acaulospora colombiana]|uniref:12386_t:CDS:1 n=1 Tax=Acaulospora colombiana TaxID=27376 RepID=A0ACA9MAJ1_9GLOM|nr:12386_t:CDS:2 [Acaulospora colombiana]
MWFFGNRWWRCLSLPELFVDSSCLGLASVHSLLTRRDVSTPRALYRAPARVWRLVYIHEYVTGVLEKPVVRRLGGYSYALRVHLKNNTKKCGKWLDWCQNVGRGDGRLGTGRVSRAWSWSEDDGLGLGRALPRLFTPLQKVTNTAYKGPLQRQLSPIPLLLRG